jgi:hypothetical protein
VEEILEVGEQSSIVKTFFEWRGYKKLALLLQSWLYFSYRQIFIK